jgi:hypothetical protein
MTTRLYTAKTPITDLIAYLSEAQKELIQGLEAVGYEARYIDCTRNIGRPGLPQAPRVEVSITKPMRRFGVEIYLRSDSQNTCEIESTHPAFSEFMAGNLYGAFLTGMSTAGDQNWTDRDQAYANLTTNVDKIGITCATNPNEGHRTVFSHVLRICTKECVIAD